jgi:PAS domain S-box-containing protein
LAETIQAPPSGELDRNNPFKIDDFSSGLRLPNSEVSVMTRMPKILLVEDNPANADSIQKMLGASYQVDCDHRLELAMARLRNENAHAILLNPNLSNAGGLHALKSLQDLADGIPILILTKCEDAEESRKWFEHGAQECLPFGSLDGRLLRRSIQCAVERKRAEKLRYEKEMEKRYRAWFEKSCEVVAVIQNHKVKFLNSAALSVCGYECTELLEESFWNIVHPEDRMQLEKMNAGWQQGRPTQENVKLRIVRMDGTMRWLEARGRSILWKGEPATISFFTDITTSRNAMIEQEKLKAQFFEAQKMESIGRLAGGIAHDFNNKLSVIIGYAELGLSELEPTHSLRESLQEILNAGRQSADLTRQLLAFARKQTACPRELDLNATVSGTLGMLRRILGEGIRLVWAPGDNAGKIYMDPSQMDQILATLAVNARDAIKNIGQVTIQTEIVEIASDFRPECTPGKYGVLSILDTGEGMPTEIAEHIFEPFFSTKGVGKGTGLGLATVYGIVSQNHGMIDVLSEPGKGSTFRIYLPSSQRTVESSEQSDDHWKIESGGKTILLVEDAKPLLDLTESILQKMGHNVISADNPIQAVEIVRKQKVRIDLLITDVVMPDMNGKALWDTLSSMISGMKCLFVSGYGTDVIGDHGILEEGLNFIQKPYNIAEFSATVRRLLAT